MSQLIFTTSGMPVLECSEHVPVGQAQVGVRMHVAVHVRERRYDLGVQRIAHIENESAAGLVIVRK